MRVQNPWHVRNNIYSNEYFIVGNPVAQCGKYSVYKLFDNAYLYVHDNRAIGEIAGLNYRLLAHLACNERPSNNTFLFDRMVERANLN